MRIEILLFDGFDELDALGPYEVFANAQADVALVRDGAAEPVTGSHGVTVLPHAVLGAPDLLVVPGGGWNDRGPAGAWAEVQRGALPARIAEMHAAGTRIASVCTGAMLLAHAGLLEGRRATTHHSALDDLGAAGAIVVDARVVDDGDIVTAAGVTSGIDLALYLVGEPAATAVAREMEWTYTSRSMVASD